MSPALVHLACVVIGAFLCGCGVPEPTQSPTPEPTPAPSPTPEPTPEPTPSPTPAPDWSTMWADYLKAFRDKNVSHIADSFVPFWALRYEQWEWQVVTVANTGHAEQQPDINEIDEFVLKSFGRASGRTAVSATSVLSTDSTMPIHGWSVWQVEGGASRHVNVDLLFYRHTGAIRHHETFALEETPPLRRGQSGSMSERALALQEDNANAGEGWGGATSRFWSAWDEKDRATFVNIFTEDAAVYMFNETAGAATVYNGSSAMDALWDDFFAQQSVSEITQGNGGRSQELFIRDDPYLPAYSKRGVMKASHGLHPLWNPLLYCYAFVHVPQQDDAKLQRMYCFYSPGHPRL